MLVNIWSEFKYWIPIGKLNFGDILTITEWGKFKENSWTIKEMAKEMRGDFIYSIRYIKPDCVWVAEQKKNNNICELLEK